MNATSNPTATGGYGLDLGTALVAAGALITTVSTFLPWEESPSLRGIEHNTLIQQGGWLLIALSLAAVGGAYRIGTGKFDTWWVPLVWIGIAAIYLAIEANSSHTLYPVKADGTTDTSADGIPGSLGIAVYVAWLGLILAAGGTRFLRDNVLRRASQHRST